MLSLLTLYLAITQFDWQAIWRTVSAAHGEWLVAALAVQTLSTLFKAARWKLLLDVSPHLSTRPDSPDGAAVGAMSGAGNSRATNVLALFAAIVIGQTFNILMPMRVGEFTRAFLARDRFGMRGAFALGTIGIEKLSDAVILFLLLLAILPWLVPPAWFQPTVLSLALTTVITLVILFVLPRSKSILRAGLASLPKRLGPRLAPLFDGADALKDSRTQIRFWLLGAAAWLCAALTNYLVFYAFNLPLALVPALFLLVALQAGIALPSLPGKIGVFNYACVLALGVFGVENEPAFAFSLGLYAVVILTTVLLGAVFLAVWSRGVHVS